MSIFKLNRNNSVKRISSDVTVGGVSVPSTVTVGQNGPKTFYIFDSSGTITFNQKTSDEMYTPSNQSKYIRSSINTVVSIYDYLVVAGGGFSSGTGGGGGGGGFLNVTSAPIQLSNLTVVVGAAANPSSIGPIVAVAGGNGSYFSPGGPGGSGGGGGRDGKGGGSGTSGQGNPGGGSPPGPYSAGGGGGGAGGSGGNGNGPKPGGGERGGNGGAGAPSSITGTPIFYSRGSGAGALNGFNNIPGSPGGPAPFGLVNSGDAGQSGRVIISFQ